MKKLLMLMMALALVAFALPALAQTYEVSSNDINGNGLAAGNTQGFDNTNTTQFQDANFGTQSNAVLNNSNWTSDNNLANNNYDNSSAQFLNKSNVVAAGNLSNNQTYFSSGYINGSDIGVYGSLNGNNYGNVGVNATMNLNGSLNNNNIYLGDMTFAWSDQHRFEHQYDHTIYFTTTFNDATDAFVGFMPISNTHMTQSNTGIAAGKGAGGVSGSNLVNLTNAQVDGMFILNANVGGVATNQAIVNAVSAFNSSMP